MYFTISFILTIKEMNQTLHQTGISKDHSSNDDCAAFHFINLILEEKMLSQFFPTHSCKNTGALLPFCSHPTAFSHFITLLILTEREPSWSTPCTAACLEKPLRGTS